ncbi:MAG: cysteine desulfurase family protein [Deltaproteobacteria bacterium]|nr:cysteine desulfurase family protein [Deltaproteobacteria bacterium]
MKPIYLDYNSTTPVDPRVFEAMKPYFTEKFGNAASATHAYGWEAAEMVEMARESIANNIGADDKKTIFFTSGATESNNLAIKGLARGAGKKIHIITQKTEHKCVLDSCAEMEKEGHQVTYLDVDADGKVSPEAVTKAIRPNTLLCSIMFANNEIGTIQPIREISKICHEKGVWLHSDAVQAVGKIPVDAQKDGIDLLSLSSHKIYGPKGIGALYVSKKIPLRAFSPLSHGGGHERGLRSGTLNVPGIVGLAKALEICMAEMPEEAKRITALRDRMIAAFKKMKGAHLNGHPTDRLPGNINVSFDGVKNDDLISALPELAIASGSACASGEPEPSYVIQAITSDRQRRDGAIRIGLGRWTTEEEIDRASELIINAVHRIMKDGFPAKNRGE